MLDTSGKLTRIELFFVDTFSNDGVLLTFGFRIDIRIIIVIIKCFLNKSPFILAVQIRSHYIRIDCLFVFQISLVIDIQRGDKYFGGRKVGYGVGGISFIQCTDSVRHGTGSITVLVSESNVEKLLVIILIAVIEIEVKVIILYFSRFSYFSILLISLWEVETFIVFARPLQISLSPIYGSAEFRLVEVVFGCEVMFAVSRIGYPVGEISRDTSSRFPSLYNVVQYGTCISVACTGIVYILDADHICRADGNYFSLSHFYTVNPKLYIVSSGNRDAVVYRIDQDA